jgi:N-methylhydantoinase A/oxoprolinase/acetone carboxylase beta subunit
LTSIIFLSYLLEINKYFKSKREVDFMAYIVGIDVGGTNTNAVLLKDDAVLATAKAPTNHKQLHVGTIQALASILKFMPELETEITLHLSTTLATNAVVEGKGEPTAALIFPGPGRKWEELGLPFKLFTVEGSIDHRGRETAPLDRDQIRRVIKRIKEMGFKALAGVGKFSSRNPQHELELEDLVTNEFPEYLPVTLGHRLSGKLNFPRRITTAVLNAGIAGIQAEFAEMIREVRERYKIGRVFILKADGGSIELEESLARPIETILSGPAASLMGAQALCNEIKNAVVIDIGGTTTEISLFYHGEPLAEKEGAEIFGFATLVPAFFSRSMGLGGDSAVQFDGKEVTIGPRRDGPPVVLGGPRITPTDAVVALGKASIGDKKRALTALEAMGAPYGINPTAMAEKIVDAFSQKAIKTINKIYASINTRPVYTVSQVMAAEVLEPDLIIGMGGPAAYFIPKIAKGMGVAYKVLPYYEAANAIGAAASRPTVTLTLRADTALGKMVIPELDEITEIPRPFFFNLETAKEEAIKKTIVYAERAGTTVEPKEIEITEEEVFNMVRGFHTIGKLYTLKAQVKPEVRPIKTCGC